MQVPWQTWLSASFSAVNSGPLREGFNPAIVMMLDIGFHRGRGGKYEYPSVELGFLRQLSSVAPLENLSSSTRSIYTIVGAQT
jgi:hypothetical protein